MGSDDASLICVYEGWNGYQLALMRAVAGLSPEQLAFRPAPNLRSPGEIISHIALGRADWFHRMGAPGSGELARRIAPDAGEKADTEHPARLGQWMRAVDDYEQAIRANPAELVWWLEASGEIVERTLRTWTVADLGQTFRHVYQAKTYAVSRQWVLWRILSHDLHHGGELALLLGLQGIAIPDLGDQGGHLTELVEADVTEKA